MININNRPSLIIKYLIKYQTSIAFHIGLKTTYIVKVHVVKIGVHPKKIAQKSLHTLQSTDLLQQHLNSPP